MKIIAKLLLTLIVLSLFSFFAVGTGESPKPKRFEDMTNKELNQFLEWDAKEQQKKWDNAPAFKK